MTELYLFFLAVVINAGSALPWKDDVSIVGGDEVDITQYPHQVLLQYGGRQWCGGSIISDEYILTAAHCLRGIDKEKLSVKIGTSYTDKGQEYNVKETLIHPKYEQLDYDFGLLQMAEKLPIDNETTRIVKMADPGSSLKPGDNIVVTGWGDTEEGGASSKVLRAVAVPVISLESCMKAYGERITENMLCAGVPEGGKDACQGDSGGPAVSVDDNIQYGVVSWGIGCAREGYPGVYSYVPSARNWIKEVSGV